MKKRIFINCIFLLLLFCPLYSAELFEYERLDGSWELYLEKSPQEVLHAKEKLIKPDCFIEVPGFWNDAVKEYLDSDSPMTYGCYRTVRKNLKPGEKYALLIKDSPPTSCAVFINGERIVQSGNPFYVLLKNQNKVLRDGKNNSQSKPLYGEFYANEKGAAEIVVFITNYYYRKSGLWDGVFIGPPESIMRMNTVLMGFYTIITGILIFIGLMNIIQFLISKRQAQYVYLGITAIVFALRVATAGYCSLGIIFPQISHELKLKLEYMVLWVVPICILQQLYTLYPSKKGYILFPWLKEKIFRFIILLPSALLGIASLVLPAVYSNRLIPSMQITMGIVCICVITKVISGIINRRKHIIFYLISCSALIIGGAADVAYTYSRVIIPMSIFPFFLVVFIFIQIILLAIYQNDIYKDTIKISKELQSLNEAYLRFVPKEFLKLLNKDSITKIELGDFSRIEMSIIYSKVHIRKNDDVDSEILPEIHFRIFNEYLQEIAPVIKANNGFVSKFLSGGFMALFPYSESDTLKTAVQIMNVVSDLNKKYESEKIEIVPRIGIHYGKMIIGTIGEKNRMDDTVISDTVNTSARIESVCEKLDKNIIISHSIEERIDVSLFPEVILNELDAISVKGKEKPLKLYECFTGGF